MKQRWTKFTVRSSYVDEGSRIGPLYHNENHHPRRHGKHFGPSTHCLVLIDAETENAGQK